MFQKLYKKARDWQVNYNSSFGMDISTPKARRQAAKHTHIVDHAFIRRIWANMHPLGAHAWRSNQPGPERFDKLRANGIRSIINLRGASAFAVYLFEQEACETYDITLHNHAISAYNLRDKSVYLSLLNLFERTEKPVLMHCKSGADRAGFAAALYMLDQQRVDIDAAKKQLALKYAHRKNSRAGVLDAFLEAYESACLARPQSIRAWLETGYDPAAITETFQKSRTK